jgi:gliding motility-associated lipoprotein GldH
LQQTNGVQYFFQTFLILTLAAVSCRQIEVQEKTIKIPERQWKRNQKFFIELDIKDSALYHPVFIIRHTDKFQFASIPVTLEIKDTAQNATPIILTNIVIPLTDTTGNWTGDRMDDLHYQQIKINSPVLLKPGRYQITLQHEIRTDALRHILNIGAALEKTTTPP